MLCSTKRRILNIISVSLAIIALGIGLGMKYTAPPADSASIEKMNMVDYVVEMDSASYSNPYFETDPN